MTVSDVLNQPGQAPADNGSAAPAQPAISEEMIKAHPLYKSLLEESITRRQTIAALKQELEAKQAPASPAPEPPKKDADPIDARIASLTDMISKLTERIEGDHKARVEMTRSSLIQQHGIPAQLQGFVNGTTEDEIRTQVNALLPFITPTPSNVGAGNTGVPVSDEDLVAQMHGILDGKPNFDPYDPAIQRKLGGGPQ